MYVCTGAISNMPAVKTFAMYAAAAILLNFFFQITAFVAFMALDERRSESGRFDLFCCLKTSNKSELSDGQNVGILEEVFRSFYAPFLLSKYDRLANVFFFFINETRIYYM